MSASKFEEFSGAVLAEWRGHPVSAAFVEWVALEADRANYECARILRKGSDREAMSVAGRAEAFETIFNTCHRKDPDPEPKETLEVDPAYRFNPDMAPVTVTEDDDAGTE